MIKKKINVSSISKIIVEGLFGKFNYVLPNDEKKDTDFSKIIILYGLNGSGKTTLLQMLFHLISPEGNKGHRTYLADIKFKTFVVKFIDGTEISVKRESCSIGPFTIYIKKNNKTISVYHFTHFKRGEEEDEITYNKFINNLKKLDVASYFLTDERDFLSDFISEDSYDRSFRSKMIKSYLNESLIEGRFDQKKFSRKEMLNELLANAIERFEKWVTRRVMLDSRVGDFSINRQYNDIIDKLARSTEEQKLNEKDWNQLIEDLGKLEKIFPKFSEVKFLTPVDITNLKNTMKNSNIARRKSLYIVLKPYIDGLNAKINALTKIYNLIENFVQNINKYFNYKSFEFDYMEGVQIKADSSDLEIQLLSSGEKQLLLLFCNLLPARDKPSIFIIDEPEISLNVEWQRDLISSLLELTEDSEIQFIFATHSIELLTQYEENVIDLIHIEEN